VSQYQKGKTNLDFTDARDSEWQWNLPGHMQACTSLQTHNHASTSLLSFLQAGCPSCHPTNGVKALKAISHCVAYIIFCNPEIGCKICELIKFHLFLFCQIGIFSNAYREMPCF